MQMNLPFAHEESKKMNKMIFETIYHAAVEQSYEIAKDRASTLEPLMADDFGDRLTVDEESNLRSLLNEYEMPNLKKNCRGAYSTFEGSPASKGILQFDMWNVEQTSRYDWSALKTQIQTYGMRNSLLLAPMPTASTSQILGYNECIEPITSNIYNRRTIAGEFMLANKYLMHDLLMI